MTIATIEIWTEALTTYCVPPDIRGQVLNALLEKERSRKPFRVPRAVSELAASRCI
jgi:hypothetical protein